MFYLVEITKQFSKAEEEKGVYAYADKTTAEANFHQKLGNWMKKADCEYERLVVVAEDMSVIMSKAYTGSAPAPAGE